MEHTEIEDAVRKWLERSSVNPKTGHPPDAKLRVEAQRIYAFGHGATSLDSGVDVWSISVTLYFREGDPTWDEQRDVQYAIAPVVDPLEEALTRFPEIGPPGLQVSWSGTDGAGATLPPNAPDGYPFAVQLYLNATYI